MEVSCVTSVNNLGNPCPQIADKGVLVGYEFAASGFSMPVAEFVDLEKHQDAAKAKTLFPLIGAREITDESGETRVYEDPIGGEIELGQGQYRQTASFFISLQQHIALQGYKPKYGYKVYSNNVITGWSDDGGVTVKPFTFASVTPQKMIDGTASTPAWSNLRVVEKNQKEWNTQGFEAIPNFFYDELMPLTDVVIEIVGVATALSITLAVSYIPTSTVNTDGTAKKIAYGGLDELTNFVFLTTAGAPQTSTGVTENVDKTYTFAFAALEDGNVDLAAPSAITPSDYLIESTGAVDIVITP